MMLAGEECWNALGLDQPTADVSLPMAGVDFHGDELKITFHHEP